MKRSKHEPASSAGATGSRSERLDSRRRRAPASAAPERPEDGAGLARERTAPRHPRLAPCPARPGHSADGCLDSWAPRTRLEPFKRLGQTFKDHFDGIRSRFARGNSNPRAESFNVEVQSVIARARGFRTFRNLRTIGYVLKGRLDLRPTVSVRVTQSSGDIIHTKRYIAADFRATSVLVFVPGSSQRHLEHRERWGGVRNATAPT